MRSIRLIVTILLVTSVLTMVGCQKKDSANTFTVGTIAGPETQLMEVAANVAQEKYGLRVRIMQFSDYTMPNEALASGNLDANMFQHAPYLQEVMAKRGYKLAIAGKAFLYPMGVYSRKIKEINQLKPGATVAIPNDPSNEARALLLLEKHGLIKLKAGVGTNALPGDIISNPHSLVFKELDASQLPRSLPDVDLAVINTNYAMLADLLSSRDALFIEDASSPYVNLMVVRAGSEKDPRVQHLIKALHSPEVLKEANKLFKGGAVAGW